MSCASRGGCGVGLAGDAETAPSVVNVFSRILMLPHPARRSSRCGSLAINGARRAGTSDAARAMMARVGLRPDPTAYPHLSRGHAAACGGEALMLHRVGLADEPVSAPTCLYMRRC